MTDRKDWAVIFDMDGVIFDTERLLIECWIPVAEAHGVEDIEGTLKNCIGLKEPAAERGFRNRYGEDFPLAEYQEEVRAIFRKRVEEEGLPEKAGAREILADLAEKNVPMALASSTRAEVVTRELANAGLLPYFRVVIGGDQIRAGKPAPDIFLAAAARLGMEVDACFVIEDSFNGIRAAAAAGMTPLMVPDQLQPDEEIRALAHEVFDDLKEVQKYLHSVCVHSKIDAEEAYG